MERTPLIALTPFEKMSARVRHYFVYISNGNDAAIFFLVSILITAHTYIIFHFCPTSAKLSHTVTVFQSAFISTREHKMVNNTPILRNGLIKYIGKTLQMKLKYDRQQFTKRIHERSMALFAVDERRFSMMQLKTKKERNSRDEQSAEDLPSPWCVCVRVRVRNV